MKDPAVTWTGKEREIQQMCQAFICRGRVNDGDTQAYITKLRTGYSRTEGPLFNTRQMTIRLIRFVAQG